MASDKLNTQNIIALIWDFDKTLISGNMQQPLFEEYGIDESVFWREVNELPDIYAKRGQRVSHDTIYLNHILSYVRNGRFKGLNNKKLRELGARIQFYPGMPQLLPQLKTFVREHPEYAKHDIRLEHYVVSTGLAEMVRGSAVAEHVDGIYGCEFLENPLPPGYLGQDEFTMTDEAMEISQVGVMVDNTIKTRFIFELNKGTNKDPEISVNASIAEEDRRIPIHKMIYVADGPSDIPVFSVVKKNGGKAYAVYNPDSPKEFAQNDELLQNGRIHAYGPANYTPESSTSMWLRMHIEKLCERIIEEHKAALASRVGRPPVHIHENKKVEPPKPSQQQGSLFTEEQNKA